MHLLAVTYLINKSRKENISIGRTCHFPLHSRSVKFHNLAIKKKITPQKRQKKKNPKTPNPIISV